MNLQVSKDAIEPFDINRRIAYKMGHRDARHAAAELIALHAPQQADARDVERWMGIGKAIERACRDLPDNTEIIVYLEKGAGTVTLIDQDGNEHENFSTDYGFAGVLNEAIDTAIAPQAKQGDQP